MFIEKSVAGLPLRPYAAGPDIPIASDDLPHVLPTLAFACAAILVSYLPFSAVNGVLGTIGTSTGASTSDLQWVTDAFAVALASVVLSAGVLGDLYGRKRIALAGLALTTLGTMLGYLAGGLTSSHAVHLLWVGQATAGIGAGLVMSSTLALIAATAAPANRTRAIATWAACNVVGLGCGAFLSGIITDHTSWRCLFLPISILAVGIGVFGIMRAHESSAPNGRQLDWLGQITGAVGIIALVYGVIQAGTSGYGSPATWGALALGTLGLGLFTRVEHRAKSPLLQLRLFASGGFTAAGVSAMAVLFTLVGVVFILSLFFAHQQASDFGIAIRLGCLFGGNAIASLAAARLTSIFSSRTILLAGIFIAATGLTSLLSISDSTDLGGFAWRLAILGTGSGLVMATSSAVAIQSVPAELAGMAGAGNNALRQLGAALGAAVLGAIFAAQIHTNADYASAVRACAIIVLALLVFTGTAAALLLARRPIPQN
ncbi:MFS transporter [Arthrobacter cryoconiti]|uniref:MFS transporter n=1 Tax=Arthrobacter cryoconiti TaxID=748907 RepID=A0ABV8R2P3_9MICC|nr:MFS transporter [Arthrobacter cryoconiti]MCC9068117.1 MFS transporter [Arthrobacter cryoconiti]